MKDVELMALVAVANAHVAAMRQPMRIVDSHRRAYTEVDPYNGYAVKELMAELVRRKILPKSCLSADEQALLELEESERLNRGS